jgi:hypothetical protein
VLAGGLRKEGRTAADEIDRVAQRAGPMSRWPGHPPRGTQCSKVTVRNVVHRYAEREACEELDFRRLEAMQADAVVPLRLGGEPTRREPRETPLTWIG